MAKNGCFGGACREPVAECGGLKRCKTFQPQTKQNTQLAIPKCEKQTRQKKCRPEASREAKKCRSRRRAACTKKQLPFRESPGSKKNKKLPHFSKFPLPHLDSRLFRDTFHFTLLLHVPLELDSVHLSDCTDGISNLSSVKFFLVIAAREEPQTSFLKEAHHPESPQVAGPLVLLHCEHFKKRSTFRPWLQAAYWLGSKSVTCGTFCRTASFCQPCRASPVLLLCASHVASEFIWLTRLFSSTVRTVIGSQYVRKKLSIALLF